MEKQNHIRKTLVNLLVFFYSLFFTLGVPLIFLRFLFRSRHNPGYRHRFMERLGIFPSPNPQQNQGIWIHAVSLGETIAASPIIFALQQQHPEISITMTTTTPTGSAQVKKMWGNSVFHVYFPLDLPWALDNFLSRVNPKLCLILETELWINTLRALKKRHIPCWLVNARLSEKSFNAYKKISWIMQDMLDNITHIAAQSREDGNRFIALGFPEKHLSVVGNVKFDCPIPKNVQEQADLFKQQWARDRPVWIAASTHAKEESDILATFKILKQEFKNLLLILVPRHPERFNSVAEEIQKHNFRFERRIERRSFGTFPNENGHGNAHENGHGNAHKNVQENVQKNIEVFLVDTMGELPLFYKTADVVFVGGSLVPVGGHNTLEPAALGKPIVVGPHTHHFQEITKLLKANNALVQISDIQQLSQVLKQWLSDPKQAIKMGENAKKVVEENRGAVKKILDLLRLNSTNC